MQHREPARRRAPGTPVDVVYVGSSMRSGSTLLAALLAEVPGSLSIGELTDVWSALAEDRTCSCGEPAHVCPLWSGAWTLLRQRERLEDGDLERLQEASTRAGHWSRWPVVAWRALREAVWWRADGRPLTWLEEVTESLLLCLRDVSGASVIVDSTKHPAGALARSRMDAVDTTLVHLTRDPRGVVASDLRTHRDPGLDAEQPPGRGLLGSVLHWVVTNLLLALVARTSGLPCVVMRYEDLVRDPAAAVGRVKSLVRAPSPHAVQRPVALGSHILVGNPGRHSRPATQDGRLTRDDRWRTELSTLQRWTVTALAVPAWWLISRRRRPMS